DGVDGMRQTRLEGPEGSGEPKICVGKNRRGKPNVYLPASVKDQETVEPIYETLDGWKKTTRGARSSKDLPAKAIKYIRRIEELIGSPAALVSTSPEREDVILMRDPFRA